ncbi:MAG: DUF3500 domain-containing protein [Verrucomicrobia bacterium]|nr:DUF3500 domain-containing protein [Verrucomicrobiota bacterium]
MKTLPFVRTTLVFALLSTFTTRLSALSPAEDMAGTANNFLASLTAEQKGKATFEFKSGERENWHFIPRARKGLTWKDMKPEQQHLAHALLSSALSQRGFIKATTVMSLEQVLKELEAGTGTMTRDAELYYFSVFGNPSEKEIWGYRVEGHHLSLNFTLVPGKPVAVTPSFFGANPGQVRRGPRKGLRTLAREEDLARKLVVSLSDEQRKVALYTNVAPRDIITGTNRTLRLLQPEGVAMNKLTKAQAETLWDLLQEYVRNYRPEVADKELERIQQAGLEKIYFAWAGSTETGKGHYYRIQGPTFLVEYDNTQNDANHIHAVWRDRQNDFGDDVLKRHYQEQPHK